MNFLKCLFIFIPLCGLISCGISQTATRNVTNINTNVDLSRKNFVVLGNVSGSTNNWFLFGLGGLISKNLLGEAYREMERNAELKGTSRVIINVTYDVHYTWVLIYSQYKIKATGTVIEFIDEGYDAGISNRNSNSNAVPRPNTSMNTDSYNTSVRRETESKQTDNEVVVLTRQTNGRPQQSAQPQQVAQSQQSIQPQQVARLQQVTQAPQSVQVDGWYYANASNGKSHRTDVRLTVERRDVTQGFPQYLILSIDGRSPNQQTIASYNNKEGSYIFNWGNNTVHFYFTL